MRQSHYRLTLIIFILYGKGGLHIETYTESYFVTFVTVTDVFSVTKQSMSNCLAPHYSEVIMSTMASQITSFAIVYSTVHRRSKKTSKLRVTGLCEGKSPMTGEPPLPMASYADSVSIWWRHHDRWSSIAEMFLMVLLSSYSTPGLHLTPSVTTVTVHICPLSQCVRRRFSIYCC